MRKIRVSRLLWYAGLPPELRTGEYDCDCLGKVVLDVGGFEGRISCLLLEAREQKKS